MKNISDELLIIYIIAIQCTKTVPIKSIAK